MLLMKVTNVATPYLEMQAYSSGQNHLLTLIMRGEVVFSSHDPPPPPPTPYPVRGVLVSLSVQGVCGGGVDVRCVWGWWG